eukprot:350137-Chlamydomonas_euryale.AAC.4
MPLPAFLWSRPDPPPPSLLLPFSSSRPDVPPPCLCLPFSCQDPTLLLHAFACLFLVKTRPYSSMPSPAFSLSRPDLPPPSPRLACQDGRTQICAGATTGRHSKGLPRLKRPSSPA